MRLLFALVLVVLLGCEAPGLKAVAGELVVSPEALTFEPTFVGFPRSAEVTIGNRSRASRTLTVRVTGPFEVAGELIAAGGADTALPISFAPVGPGDFTGKLTISDAVETLVVELSGTGLRTPVCANTACEMSAFDPALGRCVGTQVPNGTSCTNACISGGMCANGRCVGTQVDCSDGNPCTLDACDPAVGCQHPAAECNAPVNPCKAAKCDPTLGCVESDVRDGTACGDADCVSAQICIGGMCKSLPVPDGAACGAASPCQGLGTCQQNVCVQPPGGQLHEAWSYEFPGPTASFQGVSDSAQNLYWIECTTNPPGPDQCEGCPLCFAASFTSGGVARFRTPLGIEPNATAHHLLAGDRLIYAAGNLIGAVATADGAHVWSLSLPLNLAGVSDVADEQFIEAIAATPSRITVVLVRRFGQTMARQSVLVQLEAATGTVVFAKFYDGSLSAPVIDETDAISFKVTPWYTPNPLPPPSSVVVLSSSGIERWRVTSPASMPWQLGSPVAAYLGELQLEDGELRSMTDGDLIAPAPMGTLTSNTLMSDTGRVLLRTPESANQVNAMWLRRGVETPMWEVIVRELHGTNSLSETVATSNGGFLVAGGDSRHPTMLKGFGPTGVERFACEIPWSQYGEMPVALLDRRWVVLEPRYMLAPKLHVYDVGAEMPALHGWTSARGSPAGGMRPLP